MARATPTLEALQEKHDRGHFPQQMRQQCRKLAARLGVPCPGWAAVKRRRGPPKSAKSKRATAQHLAVAPKPPTVRKPSAPVSWTDALSVLRSAMPHAVVRLYDGGKVCVYPLVGKPLRFASVADATAHFAAA